MSHVLSLSEAADGVYFEIGRKLALAGGDAAKDARCHVVLCCVDFQQTMMQFTVSMYMCVHTIGWVGSDGTAGIAAYGEVNGLSSYGLYRLPIVICLNSLCCSRRLPARLPT